MKKIIIVSTSVIMLTIIYFVYITSFSEEAQQVKAHKSAYGNVKIGIEKTEVLKIMGNPDTIINKGFAYNTDDDSYPYMIIYFDSTGKVLEKYPSNW